jgi:hypothetical protein
MANVPAAHCAHVPVPPPPETLPLKFAACAKAVLPSPRLEYEPAAHVPAHLEDG